MTTDELNGIVDDYLSRLKLALAGLPAERRQQLVDSISEHIREARSELSANSEASVRDILDRIGEPEDIATEASGSSSGPPPSRRWIALRHIAIGALALVLVFALVFVFVVVFVLRSQNPSPLTPTPAVVSTTILSFPVPVVVGLPLTKAEETLGALHLSFEVNYKCTGAKTQPNEVESQSPAGGVHVIEGSHVMLLVRPTNCS